MPRKRRRQGLSALASAPVGRKRNDLLPRLVVEMLPPGDLADLPRKLRRRDEAHVREVAASISALGFCVPILIGSGNSIVNGEVSVEAAKQLS